MIEMKNTIISGLFILSNQIFTDARGSFKKLLSENDFSKLTLESNFAEIYYSVNNKDVIRGMHFQIPPMDHVKMVYVSSGKILDVCVDLRRNSNTFGKYFSITLTDSDELYLYIPKGLAHGFASLEDNTIVNYAQTSCYSKEHDFGIKYNSFGFKWPVNKPIISKRDMEFPDFENWNSVF
jgi:dTDP-4-dehydrorhamnose 3,5-epimerase/CDP-3, 6-dideoxy-D-glycero-D-glycero-4-hexulose-5-epimerase